MDKFIDILDAWVEKGTEPPVTRSDCAELGDANKDGLIEYPALSFPEIACPLGVYYPSPKVGAGDTAFAPFTGEGMAPLDSNNAFVDMKRDGVWDFVETPSEVWRRLGLLKNNEELTREKYVACVKSAANRLWKDGFFSENTAKEYVKQATATDLHPKAQERTSATNATEQR
jgi:hypothetical protein